MVNCCNEININYTLEKHLKAICEENYQYIDLYATWELDKKIYKSMLQGVAYNFPHYSMHEGSHSKSIISNIEMVLGEDRIKLLGATETWMLLESAYLHDFGMILKNAYIEENWASDEFQVFIKELCHGSDKDLKEAAEYIVNLRDNLKDDKLKANWPIEVRRYVVEIIAAYFRGKHAQMSRDYINDFNKKWGKDLTHGGLIKPRLFNLIGEVSFLHGQDFESVMKLPYVTNGLKSDYIHPRFIAEMIRLGDLLDLDNGRFNEDLIKVFGELPQLSKYHLGKHGAVRHVLITPKRIDVSSDCSDDNEWRETRKWFDWLRSEIEKLTINWENIVPENFTDCAPQIGELTILKDGKEIDRKLGDLKLHISREKTFEILEGAGIYESKLDFLRELIQNALDASKIQMWRDLKSGIYDPWIGEERARNLKNLTPFHLDKKIYDNYKVTVKVECIDKEDKIRIIVKDKGIGIDEKSLFSIADVGKSWDKRETFKKELEDMPSWLKPTGGFGLGMQSCFIVSDKINIITRTGGNEKGRRIKIESGKEQGFITSEECDDIGFNKGTEISVDIPRGLDKLIMNLPFKELKEYDFFEDKYKLDVRTIEEYIEGEIDTTLFEVNLDYNGKKKSKECGGNSLIAKYGRKFNLSDYEKPFEAKKYFLKIDDTLKEIYFWNTEYGVFVKVNVSRITPYIYYEHDCNVYFKGIEVEPIPLRWGDICDVECDIHGMSTTETLSINRKSIKDDSISKIQEILKDSIRIMLESFKEEVLLKKDADEIKGINAFELKVLYDDFNIENNFNDKIFANNNINVALEEVTEQGYLTRHIPIKEIINKEIGVFWSESPFGSRIKECRDYLEEEVKKTNLRYILEEVGVGRIIAKYYNYKSKIEKEIHLEMIGIYVYDLNKKNEDNHTIVRKELLKNLINKENQREVIYCIEGYKDLSIDKLPHRYCDIRKVENSNYEKDIYIISPMTNGDDLKLISKESRNLFKEELKSRQDFKNLVEYVFENRAEGNNATKEQIISSYMDLIDEYYSVVKSETENSEETKNES